MVSHKYSKHIKKNLFSHYIATDLKEIIYLYQYANIFCDTRKFYLYI